MVASFGSRITRSSIHASSNWIISPSLMPVRQANIKAAATVCVLFRGMLFPSHPDACLIISSSRSEATRSRCSGSLGMLPISLHGLSFANPNLIAWRNTELMRFTSLIIVESLIMPPVFKLGVILRRLTYCSMSAG